MLLNELPLVPPWLHDITQETRNLGQGPNPSLSIWSNCTTLLQSKIAGWKLPFWKWWCLCEAFSVHQPGFFELHAKGLNLIGVIVADIKCNLTKYLPNVSLRNPEPSCPSSCSLTCTQNGTSLVVALHTSVSCFQGRWCNFSLPPVYFRGFTGVVPSFSKTRSSDWGDEKLSGSRALFWSSYCW